ncbi:hypothetical protein GCM10008943_33340 [Paenochrobactrum glaciei]|uniref:Uncharacterized protein n=1 Tax=Paenochrobactrum glaciei TaxID=486407 RepID=A0ABP3RRZ2_9HYPH
MCRPARSPSNNTTGEDVDHEGHVDETLPSGNLNLINLFVPSRDNIEDFACDVSFETTDRFEL